MAPYTIKNIKEIDDSASRFGYGDQLEARFARQDLDCARTGISYQRVKPNVTGPFGHSHGEDEEVYVVVSGSGRVKLGDDVVEIGQWDAIRVAPETVRAFAAGPDGLELLAFGTHTENDAQMQQVHWPG
jgi:mannose-6-phosphate isomerase-like protein (cupin superfamily)